MTSAPMAFTFGLGATLAVPAALRRGRRDDRAGEPADDARSDGEVRRHAPRHRADRLQGDAVAAGARRSAEDLRYCLSAGEHLPEADLACVEGADRHRDHRRHRLDRDDAHLRLRSGDDIRPGSTGKAVPGYIATVLDDDGNPMDEGTGRLAIKGPTGCRYLDDPRQRNYVENGWNVTGDTYRRDADGYYWYLARSDDMIVSSGYNIGAPEVENALLAHPAVAECAVIGVPCPERGQKVKAFIVLGRLRRAERGADREAADLREGPDRPYKYPREIEFVDALPKTATGKLRRVSCGASHDQAWRRSTSQTSMRRDAWSTAGVDAQSLALTVSSCLGDQSLAQIATFSCRSWMACGAAATRQMEIA